MSEAILFQDQEDLFSAEDRTTGLGASGFETLEAEFDMDAELCRLIEEYDAAVPSEVKETAPGVVAMKLYNTGDKYSRHSRRIY